MIPPEPFAEIDPSEDGEDAESDHLLDDFQLEAGEFAITDAIGRHLKTILEESDEPAGDDNQKERRLAVLEMAIPGDGHKNV